MPRLWLGALKSASATVAPLYDALLVSLGAFDVIRDSDWQVSNAPSRVDAEGALPRESDPDCDSKCDAEREPARRIQQSNRNKVLY